MCAEVMIDGELCATVQEIYLKCPAGVAPDLSYIEHATSMRDREFVSRSYCTCWCDIAVTARHNGYESHYDVMRDRHYFYRPGDQHALD
jgi:hypothetical protein